MDLIYLQQITIFPWKSSSHYNTVIPVMWRAVRLCSELSVFLNFLPQRLVSPHGAKQDSVSVHPTNSFSCAIISTGSGSDTCIFPSASQGCFVRLDSQLGKHPAFPCSAASLCQAPTLHWQSILHRTPDHLRHPEQGKWRDQVGSDNKQPSQPETS